MFTTSWALPSALLTSSRGRRDDMAWWHGGRAVASEGPEPLKRGGGGDERVSVKTGFEKKQTVSLSYMGF